MLDSFSIGGFSGSLQTASTNYPGGPTIGTLAQSLILNTNSGGPFSIDSFAEVINSVTGLSTGPVTSSTDITSLESAPLLPFTAPAGNPLNLSSDVSEDNNASFISGSMVTVSTANTTTLNSLQVPLNGDATTNTNFANPNNQYTLQQDLRANNINGGVAGLDVISSTGVTSPSTPVDLAITKVDNKGGSSITASTGALVLGTSFVYTIVVSNNGPSNDVGSTISDPLSSVVGLTSDSWSAVVAGGASITAGGTSGSGNISNTANVPVGGTITYTVTANVSAAATGTLSNTATVTPPSSETDTNLNNNSATDTDNLTPNVDLAITKVDNKGGSSITPSTGTVVPGTSFVYTSVVSNNGPSIDVGSPISDPLSSVVGLTSDEPGPWSPAAPASRRGHQRQRQH